MLIPVRHKAHAQLLASSAENRKIFWAHNHTFLPHLPTICGETLHEHLGAAFAGTLPLGYTSTMAGPAMMDSSEKSVDDRDKTI